MAHDGAPAVGVLLLAGARLLMRAGDQVVHLIQREKRVTLAAPRAGSWLCQSGSAHTAAAMMLPKTGRGAQGVLASQDCQANLGNLGTWGAQAPAKQLASMDGLEGIIDVMCVVLEQKEELCRFKHAVQHILCQESDDQAVFVHRRAVHLHLQGLGHGAVLVPEGVDRNHDALADIAGVLRGRKVSASQFQHGAGSLNILGGLGVLGILGVLRLRRPQCCLGSG